MKRKLTALLCVLFIFVLAFSGCSQTPADSSDTETGNNSATESSTQPQPSQEPKELRIALASEPPTMDIHLSNTTVMMNVATGVFETLVRSENGSIVPAAAESWTTSDDGLVWTFKIRKMNWDDGTPLTAQHFYDSFKRQCNPDIPSPNSGLASYFKNGEKYYNKEITDFDEVGIKVLDDYTLELTLENPTGYLLQLMTMSPFGPIRIDKVDQYKEAYGSEAETLNFNGPFVITEWIHEQKVVIEKNPNYWNADKINLDRVIFDIIPDASTRASMFDTGELDFVDLGNALIPKYRDQEGFASFSAGSVGFLLFKCDNEFLQNQNLRLAFGWAIDRQGIGVATEGTFSPANRFVPDLVAGDKHNYTAETPDVGLYDITTNKEKANEYLNKALEELNVEKKDIKLSILADDSENSKLLAELLQDCFIQVLDIKIDITLKPLKQKQADTKAGQYEILLNGWGPDFSDPMGYLYAWDAGSVFHHREWENESFYADMAASKTELDNAKRIQLLGKAEQELLDGASSVPLYFKTTSYLQKPYVKNITRGIVGADINYLYADIVK